MGSHGVRDSSGTTPATTSSDGDPATAGRGTPRTRSRRSDGDVAYPAFRAERQIGWRDRDRTDRRRLRRRSLPIAARGSDAHTCDDNKPLQESGSHAAPQFTSQQLRGQRTVGLWLPSGGKSDCMLHVPRKIARTTGNFRLAMLGAYEHSVARRGVCGRKNHGLRVTRDGNEAPGWRASLRTRARATARVVPQDLPPS
jgi:hypothetical protein